jgi:hypothetical protein
MEAPAGDVDLRSALVCAATPRTAAIAEEERRLSRLGVVAVADGRCPDPELADVGRIMVRHFRLEEGSVQVSMRAVGEFLLVFDNMEARNAAVGWQGVVAAGAASFMLSPWTRFRGARAGKLFYKVRVCIEGVPPDAHQVETTRGLFGATDIINGIDPAINCKEESACCRVWVWMANVATLARRGKLDLEEPMEIDSPLFHFPEIGVEADMPVRSGPLKTLSYDVILHLDRVLDFSESPASSPESHVSFHSDVSGMPSDVSMSSACPTTWGYRWFLGLEAGTFPPPPPRASVQSRLRFPGRRDGDGGGDGAAGDVAGRRSGGNSGAGRRSRWDQQEWNQFPSSPAVGDGAGGHQRQLADLQGAGGTLEGSRATKPTGQPVAAVLQESELEAPCMPNLLDVDHQPGQTRQLPTSPKEKEAEGLDDVPMDVHGHAEQAWPGWGMLPEDGVRDESAEDQEEGAQTDGLPPSDEGLLFGPHSPWSPLGQDDGPASKMMLSTGKGIGPVLMEADEAAREMVRGGTVTDLEPLDAFLVNLLRPTVGGLLPPPPPPAKQSKGEEIDGGKRSARLAAKPTAGLSIMEKVSIVLLKKSGVVAEDAVPQAADL